MESRTASERPAQDPFAAIEQQLADVIARLEALPPLLSAEQKISLSASLVELQKAAAKLGVVFLLG